MLTEFELCAPAPYPLPLAVFSVVFLSAVYYLALLFLDYTGG